MQWFQDWKCPIISSRTHSLFILHLCHSHHVSFGTQAFCLMVDRWLLWFQTSHYTHITKIGNMEGSEGTVFICVSLSVSVFFFFLITKDNMSQKPPLSNRFFLLDHWSRLGSCWSLKEIMGLLWLLWPVRSYCGAERIARMKLRVC